MTTNLVCRTRPARETRREARQSSPWLPATLLAACATAGASTPAAVMATEPLFEPHEVVTGATKRQTVVPGFFLGGTFADLAVVHRDADDQPRLRLFAFDGAAWAAALEASLRPEVSFVDVVEAGGRHLLITWGDGRLSWFDPAAGRERPLAHVTTEFRPLEAGEIPRIDVSRDLNGDGRDDLVVPSADGFWVSTQRPDGTFHEPMRLGPREPLLDEVDLEGAGTYRDAGVNDLTVHWYLSRLHQMDYDRDGRGDLVFWNRDRFDVHRGNERGTFDAAPSSFVADAPFDFDGAYALAFLYGDMSVPSLLLGSGRKRSRTVLHSFPDINGDGVGDLMTLSIEGRTPIHAPGRYEVYLGRPSPTGTAFATDVAMTIRPRTTALGMLPFGYCSQWWRDLDGDGHVDLMLGQVRMSVGGMLRAMIAKSIALDLELYRSRDGIYPARPTTMRRVRPDRAFLGRQGPFFPLVLLGDVNGDGRADLVTGESRGELHVFLGVGGPGLLESEPRLVTADVPDNELDSSLADLNRDGKQDLVMVHKADDGPHRVTILVAR